MMNVALVGPTCAGKTTCASRLCELFQLRHLSTGQVLRENRIQQTALGILTRKYVERGQLVPNVIVNAMIEEAVRKLGPEQGLLLDGFPSTLYQARFLDELFHATGRRLDAVLWLQIPEAVVFERAARREPPRPDDRPEILHHRLRVFHRTTGPVLDFYRKAKRLVYLDATGSIEAVSGAVAAVLEQIKAGSFQAALADHQNRFLDDLLTEPVPGKITVSQPSLDLIVMGAPGSGKGTHASFLASQFAIPHIATGNLFRENLGEGTLLGKIARAYIDRGELVPDDVTESMIRERLSRADAKDGFVLDGFPRTLPQCKALDEIMAQLNRKIDSVIFLVVPDEEIVNRIAGRWLCPLCQSPYHLEYHPPKKPNTCDRDGSPLYRRDDDIPDTVRARLKIFRGQTLPVIEYYRQANLLFEVPGSGEVAQVDGLLLAVMKKIKRQ